MAVFANVLVNTRPLLSGALPAADRARLAQAQGLMHSGQLGDAETLLRQLLQRHPASFDALNSLGLLAGQLGRHDDAVQLLRAALSVDAKQSQTLVNLARALHLTQQDDGAVACVDMALELDADNDAARLESAAWQIQRNGRAQAVRLLAPMQFVAAEPNTVSNARAALRAGQAAQVLGDFDQALRYFEQTLQHDPQNLAALRGRATALLRLEQFEATLSATQPWLALEPTSAEAWNLHGAALLSLRRFEDACDSLRQALQIDTQHLPAISNFANALQSLQRHEDAALALERLLALWPEGPYIKGKLLHCKMLICDWLEHDSLLGAIEQDIDRGLASAEPFGMQAYIDSPARLQRAARSFARLVHPDRSAAQAPAVLAPSKKIRIGYVSGEFRQQATSMLLVQVLELHDRERFEVFAFDNGPADASVYRQRIEAAVTELVPIGDCSDAQALRLIRERGIHILVNLNGYFGLARTDLFSLRPAPVQVNFLGFPGTLGAPYMDYLVADRIVIPAEHRSHYDEAVVLMPDSYQPNHTQRPAVAAAVQARRHEHGLPEDGFVFCNFNHAYKITPTVFAVWMRLLARVPGSVLWLLRSEEAAVANLRAHAQGLGIDSRRLVFALHVDIAQHLARLPLADLVLDTLPYNAHTTASDALWAGVPMVTCLGSSFPGRVGASLLSAAGLPGLIAHTLVDYEALALRLATTPPELAAWRAQLAHNRSVAPLFDSTRYCRHLEAAYEEMMRRARLGLPPAAFEVATLPQPASAAPSLSLAAHA